MRFCGVWFSFLFVDFIFFLIFKRTGVFGFLFVLFISIRVVLILVCGFHVFNIGMMLWRCIYGERSKEDFTSDLNGAGEKEKLRQSFLVIV